jgi:hypothetical protein
MIAVQEEGIHFVLIILSTLLVRSAFVNAPESLMPSFNTLELFLILLQNTPSTDLDDGRNETLLFCPA